MSSSQLYLVVHWTTLGTKVYPLRGALTTDFLESPAGQRLLQHCPAYITTNPPSEGALPHVH